MKSVGFSCVDFFLDSPQFFIGTSLLYENKNHVVVSYSSALYPSIYHALQSALFPALYSALCPALCPEIRNYDRLCLSSFVQNCFSYSVISVKILEIFCSVNNVIGILLEEGFHL